MSSSRVHRRRRDVPGSVPPPGDPNEAWQATAIRLGAQKLRHDDPAQYRVLRIIYVIMLVPFGVLLVWLLVVSVIRLFG